MPDQKKREPLQPLSCTNTQCSQSASKSEANPAQSERIQSNPFDQKKTMLHWQHRRHGRSTGLAIPIFIFESFVNSPRVHISTGNASPAKQRDKTEDRAYDITYRIDVACEGGLTRWRRRLDFLQSIT